MATNPVNPGHPAGNRTPQRRAAQRPQSPPEARTGERVAEGSSMTAGAEIASYGPQGAPESLSAGWGEPAGAAARPAARSAQATAASEGASATRPGAGGGYMAALSRKCFYLFDDDQSCGLATLRMAMRGLSELVWNCVSELGDNPPNPHAFPEVSRQNLAALIAVTADRLDDLIGLESVGYAWLEPGTYRPTERTQSLPV